MENKNNSKSARRKLFFTRCGIFAILLLMLLPMLCSAAPPPQTAQVTVTIENPNNIPQDMTISNSTVGGALEFGTNITYGDIITVVDGILDDGETDLPDGQYIMFDVWVEQPAGFNNILLPNGDMYSIDGLPVFLSNAPKLTVSEADEEMTFMVIPFVVPVPNPTDSLLNTWTSITNWVISSLNTVQGVFVSRGGTGLMVNDYLDMSRTISYDGYTFAYVNYQTFPEGDLYYGDQIVNAEGDVTIDTVSIDGVEYTVVYMNGVPLQMTNIVTGIFFNTALDLSIGGPADGYELTLLGTLAVIGVSIAICFLLIGVIQKFLRLRS